MPIDCPICNNAMINKYYTLTGGSEFLKKTCTNITHNVSYKSCYNDYDSTLELVINSSTNKFIWNFEYELLFVVKSNVIKTPSNSIKLPFFMPDLYNYNNLLNKLKTYVLIS